MYGKELENVNIWEFILTRVTWADHIRKIEDKCKKVINVMRCLTGRD